jgi:hypothetical protein
LKPNFFQTYMKTIPRSSTVPNLIKIEPIVWISIADIATNSQLCILDIEFITSQAAIIERNFVVNKPILFRKLIVLITLKIRMSRLFPLFKLLLIMFNNI